MSLLARIDADIKDAMRAREAEKLNVLRMLKSSIKSTAMEKGVDDNALDEQTSIALVRKEMKKRQDAIESFEKGNRPELAALEKQEAELLSHYLPQALSESEVEQLVKDAIQEIGATSKAQMGAVMKLASTKAAGRADGKALSSTVNTLLP